MTDNAPQSEMVHGTAIVLGEVGILIVGPSGSAKSTLALSAIDEWAAQGRHAALIADDQVEIRASHGRLIAAAPPSISGMAELRYVGLVRPPTIARATLGLLVSLVPPSEAPRLPLEGERAMVCGIWLPQLTLPAARTVTALLALRHLLGAPHASPTQAVEPIGVHHGTDIAS